MSETIETLLLLALPASGKSEVRNYLTNVDAERCRRDFGIGPTVQLDDYPYVHLMRRIDEELLELGASPLFFDTLDGPFREPLEWGTLIELLNEDYQALSRASPPSASGSSASRVLARVERARRAVGGDPRLTTLEASVRQELEQRLEPECLAIERERASGPGDLTGKTVVIEFSRGGPDGASMPLEPPRGYGYSLALLSEAILARARVLYIWVTPEESRRKNEARARPDGQASILHHGVPREVMLAEYGCDDLEHLAQTSSRPGTLEVRAHDELFFLPLARFDNRQDKTSFLRQPPADWPESEVGRLHQELVRAFGQLR